MKKLTIIVLLSIITSFTYSQDLKVLNPTSKIKLDFSSKVQKEWELRDSILSALSSGKSIKDFSEAEMSILNKYGEVYDDMWDIVGGGCSWYCGGGPKEVTASSYLKSQAKNSYIPQNAHDLSYKTAWVEGVAGYGIGENLVYHFEPESPRINKIIIVNGYVKSKSAWTNNSRVKQLKMYVNDKPYAILNLNDIIAKQSFSVEPIGNEDRQDVDKLKLKPEWTIKFEILDVYKGAKFDDVVISEIYFDGLDVHCFAKGTKIQLSNYSQINIEDLKPGDSVITYDFKNNKSKASIVEKLEAVKHLGLVTYTFENGDKITSTQDHPFKIREKGWSSLMPEKSKNYKGFEVINKIKLGDLFLTIDSNKKLASNKLLKIEYIDGEIETYTISKLNSGDNFIANGLIVGVEELND